mgnify:CR=1 FL=1
MVHVKDHIHAHHGDNGGGLEVGGDLKCKVIISETYFTVDIEGNVEADTIITDRSYAGDFAKGMETINFNENADVFVDELQSSRGIVGYQVFALLLRGKPIFRF